MTSSNWRGLPLTYAPGGLGIKWMPMSHLTVHTHAYTGGSTYLSFLYPDRNYVCSVGAVQSRIWDPVLSKGCVFSRTCLAHIERAHEDSKLARLGCRFDGRLSHNAFKGRGAHEASWLVWEADDCTIGLLTIRVVFCQCRPVILDLNLFIYGPSKPDELRSRVKHVLLTKK